MFWDTGYKDWCDGPPDNNWTSNPLLGAYVDLRIAGGIKRSTLAWLSEDIFKERAPLDRIASIACGAGAADRQALVTNLAKRVDGFDFSEGSLEAAAKQAAAAGLADRLDYRQHDFNNEPVPNKGRLYPLIIVFGGLHHASNLEYVLDELKKVLAPGGLIFFNEYIGPNRFQYSSSHVEILNEIIASLPDGLCVTDKYNLEDAELLAKNDPSEAVRSEEIIDKVNERFHFLDRCDFGGSLLYPMWATVLKREYLMLDEQISRTPVLQSLILLEETLTSLGVLPSLFSQCVVCRKEEADQLSVFAQRLGSDSRVRRPSRVLFGSDLSQLEWPAYRQTRSPSMSPREAAKFILKKSHLLEPLKRLMNR